MAGIASSSSSSNEDLTTDLSATVDPVNILLEKRKWWVIYSMFIMIPAVYRMGYLELPKA